MGHFGLPGIIRDERIPARFPLRLRLPPLVRGEPRRQKRHGHDSGTLWQGGFGDLWPEPKIATSV